MIKYHINTSETDILDFKDISRKKGPEKFYNDLPKNIQSFTLNKGGVLVVGVDPTDEKNPIRGIPINIIDSLCNNISRRSANLKIPVIFSIREIFKKN